MSDKRACDDTADVPAPKSTKQPETLALLVICEDALIHVYRCNLDDLPESTADTIRERFRDRDTETGDAPMTAEGPNGDPLRRELVIRLGIWERELVEDTDPLAAAYGATPCSNYGGWLDGRNGSGGVKATYTMFVYAFD